MSNLLKAAAENDVQKVHRLLKAGVDVNFENDSYRTALHECTTGEVAEMLIKSGANVDCQDYHNSTPLILASELGQVSKVDVLLKYGADVNLSDNYADTAAHWAARFNQLEVMKLLLTKNPDLDLLNDKRLFSIDIAHIGEYNLMADLMRQYIDKEAAEKANISTITDKIDDDYPNDDIEIGYKTDDSDVYGDIW